MPATKLPAAAWPLTVRPCDPSLFTTPSDDRSPNPFDRAGIYDRTLRELRSELEHLAATAAHIRVVCAGGEADIRQDGQLRARANITHPGVSLTIVTPAHGTLVYTCDRFEGRWTHDPPDWQINLRAITVGLHDLRRLDRYGVASRGQQYAGFRELGAGTAMGGTTQTREQVARYLATMAGWATDADLDAVLHHPGVVEQLYRQAAKRHHPDHGGDATTMAYLTAARDHLLEQGAASA